MISEYKLTSDKISGEIIITYNNGHLFSIVFKLKKPLSRPQWEWLFANILYLEIDLNHADGRMGNVQLRRITPDPTIDKVAMFCQFYKRYVKDFDGNPMEYIRSKKDHLIIKSFEVNETLLTTYFTSDKVLFKGNYSIWNYIKFFNELRAEAAGANKKSQFPNHYDGKFVKTLSGNDLGLYHKHLHSVGLVPKKNSAGQVVDFVPSNAPQQTPSLPSK